MNIDMQWLWFLSLPFFRCSSFPHREHHEATGDQYRLGFSIVNSAMSCSCLLSFAAAGAGAGAA